MKRPISKLELFVTEDCNLRCDYCYIEKRKSHMSWEIAKKAIDVWLRDFNPKIWYIVEFFGGEPMLRFDLIKKIEKYIAKIEQEKKFRVSYKVVTNGTILNKEIVDFLKERPFFYLTVSCDGVKEVHDKHRKDIAGKGSFETIMKNLEVLRENGLLKNEKTSINMVVTPDTVGSFCENYRFFADFDAEVKFSENFFQATTWTKENFVEYRRQVAMIVALEKMKLKQGKKARNTVIMGMIKHFLVPQKNRYVCQAAREYGMTVDSKGDMFLCHRFESLKRDEKLREKVKDFYLGNILEYEEIDLNAWEKKKEKMRSYIKENKYPRCEKCKVQKFCVWIRCFWNNYAVYHDLYEHNDNVCKKLEYFLPPVMEFYVWLRKENYLEQYFAGFGKRLVKRQKGETKQER